MPPKPAPIDPSTVPGWGVDADPENDPTWPMKNRSRDDGLGANWPRPPLQPQTIEVLTSIEYKRRPAVFGTASPPNGLSGMIRRVAFLFSESRWTRWLMLMGADRINVVEGLVADLARGRVPNLIEELGLRAEWKYDRMALARSAAAVTALSSTAMAFGYVLLRRRQALRAARHQRLRFTI